MDLHKDLMLDTCLISSMMSNKNHSFAHTHTHIHKLISYRTHFLQENCSWWPCVVVYAVQKKRKMEESIEREN